MYIGLGIVLLVLGLILAFDVITVDLSYVNDNALGVILIVCGILAIVLSFALTDRYRRRHVVVDSAAVHDRHYVDDPIVEERRYR
ncbi:DUF6458 family protein [Nocardioides marmorisolisilvae]|uniref:DUF6458 domain-containing protein n=1 Tax=Nocardioides marmorisolisilvae TaxID=1542737 RepID=A0A3N0DPX6_9ACTN|nr:DUF6458 family protein [Nocardioides marmorisolisilvae]RNL77531.1 hypothetical protein EFL95_16045 [Nocardioides marmorisolisilvae]